VAQVTSPNSNTYALLSNQWSFFSCCYSIWG